MSERSARVLVLDDERSIRESLGDYLQDVGFDVTLAETSEDALSILGDVKIDAAIVDIRLPGMDGSAFIAKAHQLQPSVKFLVHTGSVGYRLDPQLVEIGVNSKQVFHKPVQDMDVFASALADLLT